MVEKATKKKRAKKKARGRPKGSRTKEKPTVLVHPTRCPSCGSTETRNQAGQPPRVMSVHGVLSGDIRYTSVVWRNKKCDACGQYFRERSYQFDPAEWK